MENYAELALRIRAASRQIFEPDSTDPRWIEARDMEWAAQSLLRDIHEFQARFRRENKAPLTRWDLESDDERKRWMRTPSSVPECISCGQPFKTEADYWKHYIIPEIEYPNLGNCWKRTALGYAGRKEGWEA